MAQDATLKVDVITTLDNAHTVRVKDLLTTGADINDFDYTITGGVPRLLPAKLGDLVTPQDFGAKGDFSNDDTSAIQAALDYAAKMSVRGGVVYMPAGIYNVSGTITIPAYVTLVGAGRGNTMLRCTESGSKVTTVLDMPNGFSTLRGVNVVYASLQATAGVCIRTTGSSNTLDDVGASAGTVGLWWYGGSATKVNNYDINDCYNNAILVGENAAGFSNDCIFTNGFCVANNGNFRMGTVRVQGRVEALFFDTADFIGSVYPITTEPGSTDGLRFSNFTNVFFDSGTSAPQFSGMNNTTLSGCWFSQRSVGAQFTNCFNLNIVGVRAWNNDAQAFIFSNCHNVVTSGTFGNNNVLGASGVQDIFVDGSCHDMVFAGINGHEAGATSHLIHVESGAYNITLRDITATLRTLGVLEVARASVSGLVVENVKGLVTKAKGSSKLPAGSTSVTVTHGVGFTPNIQDIRIQANGATATSLYVSAANSSTFTVSTQSANSGDTPFSWNVDCTY